VHYSCLLICCNKGVTFVTCTSWYNYSVHCSHKWRWTSAMFHAFVSRYTRWRDSRGKALRSNGWFEEFKPEWRFNRSILYSSNIANVRTFRKLSCNASCKITFGSQNSSGLRSSHLLDPQMQFRAVPYAWNWHELHRDRYIGDRCARCRWDREYALLRRNKARTKRQVLECSDRDMPSHLSFRWIWNAADEVPRSTSAVVNGVPRAC